MKPSFSNEVPKIDPAATAAAIEAGIRNAVQEWRKKGVIVGFSGGIDSSVSAALCVRALGQSPVLGLFMPEADSSEESLHFGQVIAGALGIRAEIEDIILDEKALVEFQPVRRPHDRAVQPVCMVVLDNLAGALFEVRRGHDAQISLRAQTHAPALALRRLHSGSVAELLGLPGFFSRVLKPLSCVLETALHELTEALTYHGLRGDRHGWAPASAASSD
jgi:NAD synthase